LGARFVYFFDISLALEAAIHFSSHLDVVPVPGGTVDIDTNMIPITLGMRYYFVTRNAPKPIAIANPYLGAGAGAYQRSQTILSQPPGVNTSQVGAGTNSFGVYFAGGIEFPIYGKNIYMGIDLRYHLIFFGDEDDTFGVLPAGSRSGDLFTPTLTMTYSF